MIFLYPLFVDKTGREAHLKAIYTSEQEALQALAAIPEHEDIEYSIEEWPVNELSNRWNIRVVASK